MKPSLSQESLSLPSARSLGRLNPAACRKRCRDGTGQRHQHADGVENLAKTCRVPAQIARMLPDDCRRSASKCRSRVAEPLLLSGRRGLASLMSSIFHTFFRHFQPRAPLPTAGTSVPAGAGDAGIYHTLYDRGSSLERLGGPAAAHGSRGRRRQSEAGTRCGKRSART